jgi:hypothetical protein
MEDNKENIKEMPPHKPFSHSGTKNKKKDAHMERPFQPDNLNSDF